MTGNVVWAISLFSIANSYFLIHVNKSFSSAGFVLVSYFKCQVLSYPQEINLKGTFL